MPTLSKCRRDILPRSVFAEIESAENQAAQHSKGCCPFLDISAKYKETIDCLLRNGFFNHRVGKAAFAYARFANNCENLVVFGCVRYGIADRLALTFAPDNGKPILRCFVVGPAAVRWRTHLRYAGTDLGEYRRIGQLPVIEIQLAELDRVRTHQDFTRLGALFQACRQMHCATNEINLRSTLQFESPQADQAGMYADPELNGVAGRIENGGFVVESMLDVPGGFARPVRVIFEGVRPAKNRDASIAGKTDQQTSGALPLHDEYGSGRRRPSFRHRPGRQKLYGRLN